MYPLSHTRHEGYIPYISVRGSQLARNRHNRPNSAHFYSSGVKFAYFGEDLCEAV
jgi:hypothetical protein